MRKTPTEVAFAEYRAVGVEPDKEIPWKGTRYPHPCTCKTCGAHISPRLDHIRSGTGACKKCGNIRAHEKTRVSTEAAFTEYRTAGIEPDTTIPWKNVTTPHPGTCKTCGNKVAPRLNSIRNGHSGCRKCAKIRSAKKRQIPIKVAFAEFRTANIEPDNSIPWKGANTKHPGTCMKCGNKVAPRLNIIRMGIGACTNCAIYGFKTEKLSIIYLIQHDKLKAVKVGVANIGSNRLKEHTRNGWELIKKWETTTGQDALIIEKTVLSYWRSSGAPIGVNKESMPQKGINETAPTGSVNLTATIELINITILNLEPPNPSPTASP